MGLSRKWESTMSAWVVSTNHINAIVRFLEAAKPHLFANAGRHIIGGNLPAEEYGNAIGKLLLAENVRSVNHRYNDHARPAKFVYDPAPPPVKPIEALKLIDCLDYQSCERDDWHKSKACLILNALKIDILRGLAGLDCPTGQKPVQLAYNETPWGI